MFLSFLYNQQSFSYIKFVLSSLVWEIKLNVNYVFINVIAFVLIVIGNRLERHFTFSSSS